ncbi:MULTISPECIES: HD domain-containing protein [unclassified Francisella]|uniref:HD domain-containing protein n=1 Tax=unclassified Francisella TaxID=2610885 RepID=UPI002E32200D|nr:MULTISPECIES: ATP-binding protein [unclassified Francisella]MED7819738.1 ATP-binding protein [Francisella sp. 19S2-4]MED7830543.1 ATP-binding protein [Francisella sp. 19S2-10]
MWDLSIERIKNTKLWRRTLAEVNNDGYKDKRDELRASFIKFRENVTYLVSQISATLPGLTQHDISHLDALWEVADIICGDDYPLNPLEAFVFGGAVLLHDSALCFEAYDNGIDGIRDTDVWKDSYASVSENVVDTSELEKIADFSALRALHAHQAEVLTERNWEHPETKAPLFLLENTTLRNHLGKLIGQIAASHHWSIEDVASKFQNQVNALPSFPRDWRIDPIKIACMVRCADAAHIDSERAPDFLHALIKRIGISFTHWQAQNKLACVDLDQSDSTNSTLLFTSTRRFLESESEAWWIVYDTINMIEKEIRSSNALLESKQVETPQFQVKRVKGVESPELMAKYVQTEGWSPCMAEVHVSNLENLINSLGGEKLYGSSCDKFEVIIRELIQNSRDSIHARREIDSDFSGQITIRLKNDGEGYCLYVEDNGVGMSQRVLTGPLLDFGTSFWKSSLVQSEFPGLRSSKFKSVGQFGIGFYSVFMVADKVRVSSKPWNGGSSEIRQLIFNNGLSLRPLLKAEIPEDFNSNISTQVKLSLKKGLLNSVDKVMIKRNQVKAENIEVSIEEYISSICAAIDVSVYFSTDDSSGKEIHKDIKEETDYSYWLHRISYSRHQPQHVAEYIKSNVHRLRPIIEDGQWHGLAAISILLGTEQNFLSLKSVGGLSSSIHYRSGEYYMGYIDHLLQSAKREGKGYSASDKAIRSWALEQVEILEKENLQPLDKCILAYNLCYFGVDPIDIAYVYVIQDNNHYLLSFKQLADLSLVEDIIFVKTDSIERIDPHSQVNSIPGKILIKPLRNSNFLSLKMEEGKPENNNSILDCLYREIIKLGYVPSITIEKNIGKSLLGVNDGLIIRSKIKHQQVVQKDKNS